MSGARTIRIALVVLLSVIAACAVAYWILRIQDARPPYDFRVYRAGALAIRDGQELSSVRVEFANSSLLAFTYPPFAALALLPLAYVSASVGAVGLTAVSLGGLLVIAYLCAAAIPRLTGKQLPPTSTASITLALFAIFASCGIVDVNLRLGQVNIILTAVILLDNVADHRTRGVLTGFAAGFKIVPGIFIIFMLVTRRWADAVRATVGFVASVALGLVLGVNQTIRYWTQDLFSLDRVGSAYAIRNASVRGVLDRFELGPATGWLWLAGVILIFIGGFILARNWWRYSRLVSLTIVGLVGCLCTPIAWTHHWVWMLPAAVTLIALAYRAAQRAAMWQAMLLTGAGTIAAWVSFTDMQRGLPLPESSQAAMQLLSVGYAVAGLCAIGAFACALSVVREDHSTAPTEAGEPTTAVTASQPTDCVAGAGQHH